MFYLGKILVHLFVLWHRLPFKDFLSSVDIVPHIYSLQSKNLYLCLGY